MGPWGSPGDPGIPGWSLGVPGGGLGGLGESQAVIVGSSFGVAVFNAEMREGSARKILVHIYMYVYRYEYICIS